MFSNKNSKNNSKLKKIGGKSLNRNVQDDSNQDLLKLNNDSSLNELDRKEPLFTSNNSEIKSSSSLDDIANGDNKEDFDDLSFGLELDDENDSKQSKDASYPIRQNVDVTTQSQELSETFTLEFEALEEIYGKDDKSSIDTTQDSQTLSDMDKPTVDRHTNKMELEGLASLDISTKGGFGLENSILSNDNKDTNKKASSFKKKTSYKKSLFGNMSVKSQYTMLFTTLILGAVGLSSAMFFSSYADNKEYTASKLTSALNGEKEKFNASFRGSLIGINGSYNKMLNSWDTLEKINVSLNTSIIGLENSHLTKTFEKVKDNLRNISTNVEYVKSLEKIIKGSSNQKDSVNRNVDELLGIADRLIHIYLQSGANSAEIGHINLIKTSLKDIKSSVNSILIGESIIQSDIEDLSKAKKLIETYVNDLSNGSPSKGINKVSPSALPLFGDFMNRWRLMDEDVDGILKNSDALTKAKMMVVSNTALIESLGKDIRTLSNFYNGSAHGLSYIVNNILIISALILVASLFGLGYVYSFESEKKERELKAEADKNKKSVLKLLNDMSGLQDGDLTKKTTVEEGITLDIADSINATIDSLAVVVKKIKNSSFVMKQKTNEINAVSTKLLESTEIQSSSIVDASEAINNIAKAISEISDKTKESLITAQNSAKASDLGAIQVKESIESMNAISQNMDETVGLMKKVSDSSQQISEVVNLLSDITEETNILALNAAVQAAKSGEAGKGFKVVADSIQELADNAADATRRVGALIAAVQTDIQSVSTAIERTNKEVERGVNLSENAGRSLKEITEISNKLTEIVKSISKDATTNAAAATQISINMSQILKVTQETRESTQKTTSSISDIDKMSIDLSESVKTFKV